MGNKNKNNFDSLKNRFLTYKCISRRMNEKLKAKTFDIQRRGGKRRDGPFSVMGLVEKTRDWISNESRILEIPNFFPSPWASRTLASFLHPHRFASIDLSFFFFLSYAWNSRSRVIWLGFYVEELIRAHKCRVKNAEKWWFHWHGRVCTLNFYQSHSF